MGKYSCMCSYLNPEVFNMRLCRNITIMLMYTKILEIFEISCEKYKHLCTTLRIFQ